MFGFRLCRSGPVATNWIAVSLLGFGDQERGSADVDPIETHAAWEARRDPMESQRASAGGHRLRSLAGAFVVLN